jgi:hypothetical protein
VPQFWLPPRGRYTAEMPESRAELQNVLERINRELAHLELFVREPLTADELHQSVELLGMLEESRRMVEGKPRAALNPPRE